MPLPEPSEQDAASGLAGQEPETPGAEVVPATPRKPRKFSKLVLLTASKDSDQMASVKRQGVHCIMSLGVPGTATTTPMLPTEGLGAPLQPGPRTPEQQRGKQEAARAPLEFLRTPFGGRLLVLESFLYKQEKAVGDRVYWKCRQSVGLRCRGRAITRGARATLMHGHCHPPDKEGLEARRRRQKLPGPGPPETEPAAGRRAPGEAQGYRPLSLLSLPPKKRRLRVGFGEPWGLEFLRTSYGGSFLVHQSFLYKREKAVGDKVYWTCRDHVLHSCRSRAITQGPRVTVMRSHCHPPDMEGLEARRQQERATARTAADLVGALDRPRPRKQAKVKEQTGVPESPADEHDDDDDDDPGGPEFLKTPLGGSFLVFESFLYRREKAAGDKVYWTCRDQARMGCRSRAITQGRRVTVMRGHCHPPDLGGLEALRQREKRPGPAQRGGPGGPEFLKTPLGGSFLVFESFLYRREKAAGDKVYWTCRDQARMGCRSRAITQGPRVMVMRRHCHPPDLGGLEELRERENFPRLAQREDSETFQPLEFLRTPLGGSFLVFESFLYRKEKAVGDKVYWMCRDQARRGCRSRAITQGQQVTVMRGHCHQPDLAGLEALRQRERLPGKALREEAEEVELLPEVQLCFQACPPEDRQTPGEVPDEELDGTAP
ncbi:FLYWCH-type zinc finger-containing protein 1 isoform X2 [Sorex araneus]|uniref:FLYWCH-type zinc finger-containing protein 1 isoform X2 n=1 Tax=Sorex araneus TaxID=42254 RepID=UPI002433A532|nr:FLYWCH-type zinc finger-containing protein 1 isoform X2 [Sorex araneus]